MIHNAFGTLYPLLDQQCSTFELVLITPKFVVYVRKMPGLVEPMPSLICVNSEVFTSHTHLVFHQVKLSTLMPLSKRIVNGRLYIEEVGVDLEPCVHAQGHDV